MIDLDTVTVSLAEDLAERLTPILTLGGPDGYEQAEQTADRLARRVALSLCSTEEREVAQAVIDLASALDLGPDTNPEWWGGPVGRICARSLAGVTPTAERVSTIEAARMLGVDRSRAYQLAEAGKLDGHPDGGVTLASVYQRLGAG